MAEEKIKGEEEKMIPRPEMAESTNASSAIAAVNSKSEEDSIPNGRSASPSSSIKKTNTAVQGKSCKGCLYYSSNFQANSRNPLCVGLSRSLPNGSPNFPQFFPFVDYRDFDIDSPLPLNI